MLRGEEEEVVPHPRMDEGIEALQGFGVGEDDAGYGLLVDGAIGTENVVAEEGADLLQEVRVAVIGSRHLVGHKTGDTEFKELVKYGGFAAPDAAGEGYEQGSACRVHGGVSF